VSTAAFVLIAVFAAPAVATAIFVYLLTMTGWVSDFWSEWRHRLLGNVATMQTLTPRIVLAFTHGFGTLRWWPRRRLIELGALVLATLAAAVILGSSSFGGSVASPLVLIAIALPMIAPMVLVRGRGRRGAAAPVGSGRRHGVATGKRAIADWEWDLATGRIHVDAPLKTWLGYDKGEIQDTLSGWMRCVHPRDKRRVIVRLNTYLRGITGRFETEHRVLHKDGSLRWLRCQGVATARAEGGILRIEGTAIDITGRKRAERRLRRSNARIRQLAARLIIAQEEERRRIARDLHDDINQRLAALSIGLSTVQRRLKGTEHPSLDEIMLLQERTSELVRDVRQLSQELHPAVLEHAGLVPALIEFAAELRDRESFDLELNLPPERRAIPRKIATGLYRIAQESIRTAVRRSGSGRAALSLTVEDHRATLMVCDSGCGFDRCASDLGLIGIRERAIMLQGRLQVSCVSRRGTCLRVTVPLPTESTGTAAVAARARDSG
jgi:PAS domain S-box-containing protein